MKSIADELNKAGVKTLSGGSWNAVSVREYAQMRLARITETNNGAVPPAFIKTSSEIYLRRLLLVDDKTLIAYSDELNKAGIKTGDGGKWNPAAIRQLIKKHLDRE